MTPGPVSTSTPASTSAAAATADPRRFAGTELSLLRPPVAPWLDAITPVFTQKTGIKVTVVNVAGAEAQAKYATLLASRDSSFDVFFTSSGHAARFGPGGLFLDLTGRVEKSILDDMDAGSVASLTTGNRLFGVPHNNTVFVMFMNDVMWREAGLDTAKPPENWADFVGVLQKLNKPPTRYAMAWPMQAPTPSYWLAAFLLNASGAKPFSDDLKRVTLDTPEALTAFKAFEQVVNAGVLDPAGFELQNVTLAQAYAKGRHAVMLNGTLIVNSIIENKAQSTIVGQNRLALMPGIKQRSATVNNPQGLAVNAFSTKSDAAIEFAKFLVADETQRVPIPDIFPIRRSVGTAMGVDKDPVAKLSLEQSKYPGSRFDTPFTADTEAVFLNEFRRIADKKATAEVAVASAQKTLQERVDQFWK